MTTKAELCWLNRRPLCFAAAMAVAVLRSCHNPVESFQQLLAEGRLIDVRIRCNFLSLSFGILSHSHQVGVTFCSDLRIDLINS